MQPQQQQRDRRRNLRNNEDVAALVAAVDPPTSPIQRAFWQAITVGELDTIEVLLSCRSKDIDVNKIDEFGEQRQGCTGLHLAILEMPTWKSEGRAEGRNGIQSAEFVKKFFTSLLDFGADIDRPCEYVGEWYLQTTAGKTKCFYPEGYDALGLVLQFVEITRGSDVISTNVTRRLELIRDLLLEYIKVRQSTTQQQLEKPLFQPCLTHTLVQDLSHSYTSGLLTDVDLLAEDDTVVLSCHKFILASRSPVFAAMFRREGFLESTMNPCKVRIAQADSEALRIFVRFLYEDCLPNEEELDFFHCQELLMLSNRYQVGGLTSRCSQLILNRHLTIEQAPLILKMAADNNIVELRTRTLNFMSRPQNMARILNTKDFKELNADLVQEVLRSVVTSMPSNNHNCGELFSSPLAKRLRHRTDSHDDVVRAPPNPASANHVPEQDQEEEDDE